MDVWGKSYQIDQRGNAFGKFAGGNSAETSMQPQQFCRGEPLVESKILRQEADFPANFHVSRPHAEHKGFAARGRGEAQNHFDGSAFARSVRPEKAEDFAARYAYRQIEHR